MLHLMGENTVCSQGHVCGGEDKAKGSSNCGRDIWVLLRPFSLMFKGLRFCEVISKQVIVLSCGCTLYNVADH